MANVVAAINYMLKFEDAHLSGVITTNDDGVTKTRFGIDQRYHPELTASGFYDDMGCVAALQIAINVYAEKYCQPLCIEEIGNQDVANKLLSLGVNIGIKTASKMLQLAVKVPCDGSIGGITLMAVDSADPAAVIASLDDQAIAHYHDVVAKDPSKQKYLDGWLERARA